MVKKRATVYGMRMVSSEISDWPKVSTRSRNVPTTMKGSPLSLMTWPTAALVEPYIVFARFLVITATLPRDWLSLSSRKRPVEHFEIAHPEIFRGDPQHQHIALSSARHSQSVVQFDHRRRRRNIRNLLADRVQVVNRHVVVGRLGAVDRAAFVFTRDHVGAD